jgi:hypothetical protein
VTSCWQAISTQICARPPNVTKAVAVYAARILNGEAPSNLLIQVMRFGGVPCSERQTNGVYAGTRGQGGALCQDVEGEHHD